jgi:hypothetical protein
MFGATRTRRERAPRTRRNVSLTRRNVYPHTRRDVHPPHISHASSCRLGPLRRQTGRHPPFPAGPPISEQRYGGCSMHEKVEEENPRTIGKLIDEGMKESSKLRPARKGRRTRPDVGACKGASGPTGQRDGAGHNRYVHVGADRDRVWREARSLAAQNLCPTSSDRPITTATRPRTPPYRVSTAPN